MSIYYTKDQMDLAATEIGTRIRSATSAVAIAAVLAAAGDLNLITDAERDKLATVESSRFLGVFADLASIPTAGAVPGSYADIDGGAGATTQRAIFDVDDGIFRVLQGEVAQETPESVKLKYESNPNTNAFTDAEQAKLAALTEAADISDFTAALDAALV